MTRLRPARCFVALLACCVTVSLAPLPQPLSLTSNPLRIAAVAESQPLPESAAGVFADEDLRAVKALTFINELVNRSMTYQSDQEQYGIAERWVEMPASGLGDCEDYALTKRALLQQMGFPVLSHARITTLRVEKPDGAMSGHAVLEVLLPSGAIAILDNNFDRLITPTEVEADYGYRFYRW